MKNLHKEGLQERAVLSGDVMYDACISFRQIAENRGGPLADSWRPGQFALATVHHAQNTDDPHRLREIVKGLDQIARTICPVVWPMHPRTKKRLSDMGLRAGSVTTIQPDSYFEMLLLEGAPDSSSPIPVACKRSVFFESSTVSRYGMRRNGRRPWRTTATCSPDLARRKFLRRQGPWVKPVPGPPS